MANDGAPFWNVCSDPSVLGTARQDLALARLAAALEALLNAGVPIIGAWELAATASGSPALRRSVEGWRPRLEQGSTPAELISESGQFPSVFSSLYHTGEISGQLDQTLNRIHTMPRRKARGGCVS